MILFIHTGLSTFVKNDLDILSKMDTVKIHHYQQSKKMSGHILSQFKLFGWVLSNILGASNVYIWFADYHSFLPVVLARLLSKKVYIVIGGYDVTYIPEINYGSLKNPVRKFCTLFSMKHATMNLAVSDYIRAEIFKLVPAARAVTIYNGIRIPEEKREQKENNRNHILTVGIVNSFQRFRLKGIDVFIEIARKLPQFSFIVIGVEGNYKSKIKNVPENVELLPKMNAGQLEKYYRESRIYCQFSMVESFCLTLAEAMINGCIPLVHKVGAMPEIIGQFGFALEKLDTNKIADIITNEFKKNKDPKKSKDWIFRNFVLKKRENLLKEQLKGD